MGSPNNEGRRKGHPTLIVFQEIFLGAKTEVSEDNNAVL